MLEAVNVPGEPVKFAAVIVAPSNTCGLSAPLTKIRRVLWFVTCQRSELKPLPTVNLTPVTSQIEPFAAASSSSTAPRYGASV